MLIRSRVHVPAPGVSHSWESLIGIVVLVLSSASADQPGTATDKLLLSNYCNPVPGESREGECWMQG